MTLTIERPFQLHPDERGRPSRNRRVEATSAPANASCEHAPASDTPPGRVPRITRLMALAIKLDGYVRAGQVKDHAQLARLGHVSRARITQIMNLNLLAPDIQEALLNLPRTVKGRDPIREHHLRPIASEPDWGRQRERWSSLCRV